MHDLSETLVESTPPRRYGAEPSLEPGDSLGRYVVTGRLGQGGMGVVYRAHDPQLDRDVALKVLRTARSSSGKGQARLLREARAMARLSHPNVLPVYDVGLADGSLYLALELVRGQNLRQWMNAEPRRVEQILDRFVLAGRGLAAAHAAGLVHRDFKPDNVLVGDDGRLCVMDFGLVLEGPAPITVDTPGADSALGSVDARLTEAGVVMGTPIYMAPEQHRGEPVDEACDQYAFCVALFEALHGSRPFRGSAPSDLAAQKEASKIEPGPRHERVPARLGAALRRGLSPTPGDRWPSMEALLAAIAPRRRSRRAWILAGTLGVAAVGAGLFMLGSRTSACDASARLAGVWDDAARARVRESILATSVAYAADTWTRIEPELDEHARAWRSSYEASCSTEPTPERDRRLACLGTRRSELKTVVELLASTDAQMVAQAIATVNDLASPHSCARAQQATRPADEAAGQRVDEIRGRLFVVRSMARAGHVAEAESVADELVAQARDTGFDPVIAQALIAKADAMIERDDPPAAVAVLEEAYWLASSASDDRTATRAATRLVALLGGTLARFEDAEPWSEHAWAALERAPADPELRARLLGEIGAMNFRRSRLDDALARLDDALVLLRSDQVDAPFALAATLTTMGNVRFARGEREQAEASFTEALQLLERLYGPHHPALITAIMNTGNVAGENGDIDRALVALRRAIALVEENFGPEHEKLAGPLNNLGFILLRRGDDEQARLHLRRAIEIWERVLGPEHPNIALALLNLGRQSLVAGHYAAARVDLERSVRILEAAMGEGSPPTLMPSALLAWAELGLGRKEEGLARLAALERAVEGDIPVRDRAGTLATMADAYWRDRPATAIERARQALSLYESMPSEHSYEIEMIGAWLREHPPPKAGRSPTTERSRDDAR